LRIKIYPLCKLGFFEKDQKRKVEYDGKYQGASCIDSSAASGDTAGEGIIDDNRQDHEEDIDRLAKGIKKEACGNQEHVPESLG